MAQTALVGAPLLIACSNTAADASADPARLRADIRRLGDLAGEHGVRIAYEALCWGTHISDYRRAWDLVQQADHPCVGLLLDSSHIGALDLPMAGVREIDGGKVAHVQIADLPQARVSRVDLSRSYRMLPGEGMLDLDGFVQALDAIGYVGPCALEVLSDHHRMLAPAVAAQQGFVALERLLKAFHADT